MYLNRNSRVMFISSIVFRIVIISSSTKTDRYLYLPIFKTILVEYVLKYKRLSINFNLNKNFAIKLYNIFSNFKIL